MTFLDRMKQVKLQEIQQRKQIIAEKTLWKILEKKPSPIDFCKTLLRKEGANISVIAEVKAKAPGRQNVEQLHVEKVLQDYEAGNARAISVLTDEKYFGGSLATLEWVAQRTTLPILHKEFIVAPYQLLEGRVRGASASLILVDYFNAIQLKEMIKSCRQIGVQAVVECSLQEELPRALEANPDILLINNRPIAAIPEDPSPTYQWGHVATSIEWWNEFVDLRQWKQQQNKLLISASCIRNAEDLQKIAKYPFDTVLIGNAAMTAENRVDFLQKLQGN